MKRNLMAKGIRFLVDPDYRVNLLAQFGFFDGLDDKSYLEKIYKANLHKPLNLEHPRTFNEKLQWLKLYNRRPEYTIMVDKYKVREYIANQLGEEYLIPLLGVWDDPDEIDFDTLPDQFVLKCNHNSGLGMCICKDKSKLNIEKVKLDLRKGLKQNYYLTGREWPYRDVPRKIICEKYMEDQSMQELRDYKFFCFGGVARCYKVDFDRFVEHHANYYDMDNNILTLGEKICPPIFEKDLELPETLTEMKRLAEILSKGNPFLRVDFYDIDGHVYFGELTFFPAGGFGEFLSPEWDDKLGQWIKLPDISGGGDLLILKQTICHLQTNNSVKVCKGSINNNTSIINKISKDLRDYKFYCFDGEPKYCQVICDRNIKETIDFYDMEWKHQEFTGLSHPHRPNSNNPIPIPSSFATMKEAARILSWNIPFVRIDFYEINGKMYFGEITFFPASGFGDFEPDKWNYILGDEIHLKLRNE